MCWGDAPARVCDAWHRCTRDRVGRLEPVSRAVDGPQRNQHETDAFSERRARTSHGRGGTLLAGSCCGCRGHSGVGGIAVGVGGPGLRSGRVRSNSTRHGRCRIDRGTVPAPKISGRLHLADLLGCRAAALCGRFCRHVHRTEHHVRRRSAPTLLLPRRHRANTGWICMGMGSGLEWDAATHTPAKARPYRPICTSVVRRSACHVPSPIQRF